MEQYIDKNALLERIKKLKMDIGNIFNEYDEGFWEGRATAFDDVICALGNLEVKNPYEQCVQYDSIKAGIQAHAETYSFNIESVLFGQLTKEQQKLWRKEIEQACISGGNAGYSLARDRRYKENLEVKEVDLDKEMGKYLDANDIEFGHQIKLLDFARHFYELGLKAQKEE